MTRSTLLQPELVIAGPGAGKTYDLVSKILELLPSLEPHRFLAAITYTNTAADSIRRQLARLTPAQPNVFVGTNHAFLSRFILMPYASLYNQVPTDFIYINIDLDQLAELRGKNGNVPAPSPAERAIRRKAIEKQLLRAGKMTYDKMVIIAAELAEKKTLKRLLSIRLQYLLIDEFQDVNIGQYKVFDSIRKGGSTKIYAVGDPEQYISTYSYGVRGVKPCPYSRIPLHTLREKAKVSYKEENRRSCGAVVKFTNGLRSDLTQHEAHIDGPYSGVFFLTATKLHDIISAFRVLVPPTNRDGEATVAYYLSWSRKTLEDSADTFGLAPISNRRSRLAGVMGDATGILCEYTGLTQERLRVDLELAPIDIRKLGIKLLTAIRRGDIFDHASAVDFTKGTLNLPVSADSGSENMILSLRELLLGTESTLPNHHYATIHKAKGLEADAVLVIAESANQLDKWLTTDQMARNQDNHDMCRIGYVGFTRAKDVLCIACLKTPSKLALSRLRAMNVVFHPPQLETQLNIFDEVEL